MQKTPETISKSMFWLFRLKLSLTLMRVDGAKP